MIRWARRAALAIVDQASVAGGNFFVQIMLARMLAPSEYAIFALGYAVLALIMMCQTAVVCEPMLVYGAGRYAPSLSAYLGTLHRLQQKSAFGLAFILIVTGWILADTGIDVGLGLIGVGLALPFNLSYTLRRRAFYVRQDPSWAAVGGGIYLTLLVILLFLLIRHHQVTILGAFGVMGLAAIVGSLVFTRQSPIGTYDGEMARQVVSTHWNYGRWSLPAAAANWIPYNGVLWVLSPIMAYGEIAVVKVSLTTAMLASHVFVALSALALPRLSQLWDAGDYTGFRKVFGAVLSAFLLLTGGMGLGIFILRGSLLELLYGSAYANVVGIVEILAVMHLPLGVIAIFQSALRALERPRNVFVGYGIAALVTIVAAPVLSLRMGYFGAGLGIALALTCGAAYMTGAYVLAVRIAREEMVRASIA